MVSVQKKKVVILGAGAVGLLYGSRLLESEQNKGSLIDVHFICRRDFDYIRTNGIHMKSPDGDYISGNLSLNKKIHCDSSTIDVPSTGVDWIIMCVKSYSFQGDEGVSLKALIETMAGNNTRFLLIMNGLGCEKYLCDWFGAASIFVGMAFTCVNRNDPTNEIDNIPFILVDHIKFGALHIAHCQDNPIELDIAKALWMDTRISEKVTIGLSLLYAQWSKLCWNIPFSGLCVALGGITTDIIANDTHLRCLADKIMTDTITLANEDILWHRNMKPTGTHETAAVKLFNMEETKAFCWHLTDTMGPYKPSTLLDLIRGNDLEIEYMFNKPLERAKVLSNLHEKSNCKWSYLETIVLQVNGIVNIAKQKKIKDIEWLPTYLS